MFLYAENLTLRNLHNGIEPWAFVPSQPIPANVRSSKEDRQNWYKTETTKHYFYTGLEGVNPHSRISKENPPRFIRAIVADYDLKISLERAQEAIAAMSIKPAYIERSLGGNLRLVWTLERPIPTEDTQFCVFVLGELAELLNLGLLPGLDEQAFKAPSRLYANGCEWVPTGHPPIGENDMQAFFVKCGRKYRFTPSDDTQIPMDLIEAALKQKYPAFASWPTEFALEAQGPTFWIPESTSPMSAIVKQYGIYTFSAHAAKPFYSWSDLIGADFVKQFATISIAKATLDIFWDGKRFWRRINGIYLSLDKPELVNFLRIDCKLSLKPGKDGISPIDSALNHIYNQNRIEAAAPFVFRPMGPLNFQGDRMLNTFVKRAVPPAEGPQVWGPTGNFPFISALLDSLFDPPSQLPHFLAWHKCYYLSAWTEDPHPGPNIILMGGVNIGKTFVNRNLVGVSVGGYIDASDYLVDGGSFNSHLIRMPHWCLDDDSPVGSARAQARVQAMFKKHAANQQILATKKFEQSGLVERAGRIGCTTNLDHVSSRIVGPLDNSSADKNSLFRCAARSDFKFPMKRSETIATMTLEMPYYLKWLADWTPPPEVIPNGRFGYASYQDPGLMEQTHQSSNIAPFKELLIDTLSEWFKANSDATEWSGVQSQLSRLISATNPHNDQILRSTKPEQVNRYLEQIQREGLFKCTAASNDKGLRVWTFQRADYV